MHDDVIELHQEGYIFSEYENGKQVMSFNLFEI